MAFSKKFEKKKNRIWKEAENDLGFPLPRDVRSIIEQDVGDYDDYGNDLEGEKDYLEVFRDVTKRYVTAIYLASHIMKSPKRDNTIIFKSKKVYWGTIERRLYLINFVFERKDSLKARAKWKQITAEWNKEHPYNQKSSSVLKADFHRARKDQNVIDRWIELRIAPILAQVVRKFAEKWRRVDYLSLRKYGIKNIDDFIRLEDSGMTIDDLLNAQENGCLPEYIKSMMEKSNFKKEAQNERPYNKEG